MPLGKITIGGFSPSHTLFSSLCIRVCASTPKIRYRPLLPQAALDLPEGRDNNTPDGDSGHDQEPSSRHGGGGGVNHDGPAAEEAKRSHDSQVGFTTAVDELDDIVTGMNAFVDDSEAGLEGAEVEPVGGNVQFDVNKFMSLLNGEDLM